MLTLPPKWIRVLLLVCLVLVVTSFFSVNSGSSPSPPPLHPNESPVPNLLSAAGAKAHKRPTGASSGQSRRFSLRKYLDKQADGLLLVTKLWTQSNDPDFESVSVQKLVEEGRTSKKFKVVELEDSTNPEISPSSPPAIQSAGDAEKFSHFRNSFILFVSALMQSVEQAKPMVAPINDNAHYAQAKAENRFPNREGRVPVYGGHWRESYTEEPVRTHEYLSSFLRISSEEKSDLTRSHERFMANLPLAFPQELLDLGARYGFLQGNGIVYLGGGKYNQLVLLSVSLLRLTGSKLPVEVIMPTKGDFDIDLCNSVLPAMNGRCKIMTDFLPQSLVKSLKNFQLKSLALLVSSFKNVLYMDADNLPVRNPDLLFSNEPFVSQHMVVWPDLWRRSTSPHFYDIAAIAHDPTYRMRTSYFPGDPKGAQGGQVSFHDTKGTIPEASSETGQFMINKEKHARTLFLSVYYNYYGPDYYYPLFSQGAAGEGDKETFIAAAHKLGLPYYQVKEFNREFGPVKSNGKREYFGMGQYDPIADYYNGQFGLVVYPDVSKFPKNDMDSSNYNYDFHMYKASTLMFLHSNWPKYYFDEMFGSTNSHGRGPKDASGQRRRLYSDHMKLEAGFDFELEIIRHVRTWYCKSSVNLQNMAEAGTPARNNVCEEIKKQLAFLRS